MKCPDCGAEMKPLATSVYCPNDCDRRVQAEIDPEKTEEIIFEPWIGPSSTTSGFKASLSGDDTLDDDDWDWIDNWWDTD